MTRKQMFLSAITMMTAISLPLRAGEVAREIRRNVRVLAVTPDNSKTSYFRRAVINSAGEYAFVARIGDESGLFRGGSQPPELIVSDEPATSSKRAPPRPSTVAGIDDSGRILFTDFGRRELLLLSGTEPRTIARTSATGGQYLSELKRVDLPFASEIQAQPEGLIFMKTEVGRDTAIVVWTRDGYKTIAKAGDPAVGFPGHGIVFKEFRTMISAGKNVLFQAFVTGPGVAFANSGVWLGTPRGLELVGRSEGPAPGGRVFDSINPVAVSPRGEVLLQAAVSKPGERSSDLVIFVGPPADLRRVDNSHVAEAVAPAEVSGNAAPQLVGHYWSVAGVTGLRKTSDYSSDPLAMRISPNGVIATKLGEEVLASRLPNPLVPVVARGDLVAVRRNDIRKVIDIEWLSVGDGGDVLIGVMFDAQLGIRDLSHGIIAARIEGD